ncbi:shTK domain protein [Ancylostoma ceylanicum]|nr:shTK domain protein [Ancylostoma ceylanicum]
MRPHCQRSCQSCGEEVDTVFAPTPRKGCENNHKLCNFWAATGECDVNPNYMVPYCPLSCMIC